MLQWLDTLALPAGLYCLGLYLLAVPLLGVRASGLAGSVVLVTATSVYLLDRVKLPGVGLDPADALAQPTRHAVISTHRTALHWCNALLALTALVLAAMVSPVLLLTVVAAHVVVVLYAGRPASPCGPRRPKDILGMKYAAIGPAVAAILIVAAAEPTLDIVHTIRTLPGNWLPVWGVLAIIVTGDVVLSDLDDAPADRAFRTRTLPVWLSPSLAAWLAMFTHVLAGALLIWWAWTLSDVHLSVRMQRLVTIGIVLYATATPMLAVLPAGTRRLMTDLRPLLLWCTLAAAFVLFA